MGHIYYLIKIQQIDLKYREFLRRNQMIVSRMAIEIPTVIKPNQTERNRLCSECGVVVSYIR